MTIESILRRKGTDVTTIAPEASVKRAADWLRLQKNIGALVVMSENAVLGLTYPNAKSFMHFLAKWRDSRINACEGNHAIRCDDRVPGRECQSRDEPDDAPSRAPHAGTTRRQTGGYRQHRRCGQASAGGSRGAWRRTSCAMSTRPRVDGQGAASQGCPCFQILFQFERRPTRLGLPCMLARIW